MPAWGLVVPFVLGGPINTRKELAFTDVSSAFVCIPPGAFCNSFFHQAAAVVGIAIFTAILVIHW